jgi:hypothetical protein
VVGQFENSGGFRPAKKSGPEAKKELGRFYCRAKEPGAAFCPSASDGNSALTAPVPRLSEKETARRNEELKPDRSLAWRGNQTHRFLLLLS